MLKNRNLKRQSNIKRVFLALLLIVLTFSLLHALAEPGTVVTSGGRLNMRQSPDDKARIVTKIKNGKTVEVLDLADGWYHITYEGYEGYVKEQYIKLLSAAIGQEIYSNGTTLYLRESMDATSRIVGMVNSQQTMKVEQIDDGWILVASGVVKGYVRTEEIDQLNEEPAAVATQKWTEGILQKETTLYRDPDKNSEVLSTWPKGQGVSVCPYNKDWSLIQIQDENICGFARKASVSLSPLPTVQPDKQVVDESQYISSSKAKSIAEKALKSIIDEIGGEVRLYGTPGEEGGEEGSAMEIEDLEIFENVAYIMAFHADPSIPKTIDEWLEQFDMFSIYEVLPEILELWGTNLITDVEAKKNQRKAAGK